MDAARRPDPRDPLTAAEELGALVARGLRGAWRADAAPPALSVGELERITPRLLGGGAGALGWWVTKDTPRLAESGAGAALAEARRLHLLQAGLHERRMGGVLDLAAGADPTLVKGWSTARHYPARGLRAYGDVDLLVADAARPRLQAALDARPQDASWVDVDLRHAFLAADAMPLEVLRARSRPARFEGREFRVLGPEDELRLLCVHYVRSGGWRPLSLCDVALRLEQRPRKLDWTLVVPAAQPVRGWVLAALGLATELLGADATGTPADGVRAPEWVRRHVLAGFGSGAETRRPASRLVAAGPGGLARQLATRWPPDPLEVLLHHRRRLRRRPPRHVQVYDLATRAVTLALPDAVETRRPRIDGSHGR